MSVPEKKSRVSPLIISAVVSETMTFDLRLPAATDRRQRLSFTSPWSWSERFSSSHHRSSVQPFRYLMLY